MRHRHEDEGALCSIKPPQFSVELLSLNSFTKALLGACQFLMSELLDAELLDFVGQATFHGQHPYMVIVSCCHGLFHGWLAAPNSCQGAGAA